MKLLRALFYKEQRLIDEDFGISKIVPRLNKAEVEMIKKEIEKCGVENVKDLSHVTFDDLMQCEILNTIEARKLIKQWKKGNVNFSF